MLFLGLLLVVLGATAATLLIAYNSSGGPEQMIVLFGRDLVSVTPLQAFIAGIVVALVFCLGLWMVVTTERHRRAARSEYRAVRREARSAAAERDKLAKELAREQERTAASTPPVAPAAAAAPQPTEQPAETPRAGGIGRHFRRTPQTDEARDEQATRR